MPIRTLRLLAVLIALLLAIATVAQASPLDRQATPTATGDCVVTLPNGETPPGEEPGDLGWFGSGAEDASLWLLMTWEDGTWIADPPARLGDIDGYPLKLTFWRGEGSGDVTVTATSATGLTVEAGAFAPFRGTAMPGIHPLGGAVPALGCWTFAATDGNDTLTWTLRIASPFGDCPVSRPNGENPPAATGDEWYGSGVRDASLWVLLPMEPIVPSPSFEPRNEGFHSIKTPFWRGEGSGTIRLTGERIDAPSALEPRIDAAWDSYPAPGFIATGVWYPSEGCWRLTASDENGDVITWTVLVQSPFAGCEATSGADDDGTLPEDVIPGMLRGNPIPPDPDDYYGQNGLYVTLSPDTQAYRYPIDSRLVSDDGAISDKFVWYRDGDAAGQLAITVENASPYWLPGEAEISVPDGYGASGVQASGITFPGPGCWEITGTSGDVSITFTIRLEIAPAEG